MVLQSVLNGDPTVTERYLIGLVGQGAALDALVQVVNTVDFATAFPWVRVAGWVPEPGKDVKDVAAGMIHVLDSQLVFSTIEEMFEAQPDIVLALDLSENLDYMGDLRRIAGRQVSLGTSQDVLHFCAAAEDGRLAVSGGENLRKAERLFALLVDQLHDDILIVDKEGIIIDANRHALDSRGVTRSQLLGKHCSLLDEVGLACTEGDGTCAFEQARNTGRPGKQTFSQVIDGGKVRYLFCICFPVENAFGEPSQYLIFRRDVTEQKHLEQRLQQSEKMAAIGELSTYMAHEIRNPLFSIGGFANALLRNPSLNDLAREKARIIYDESRRLDETLTSILNFARPTDQKMGVFDVGNVARQTIDLMTMGSSERGIEVKVDIDPHLSLARGNAENLKQCLINMVKNATEAMPDGGTLSMRAWRNNNFVQIDVEDSGGGIPVELHEQVFSPFFTTKHGGAGLGLAMTRKVIEEMGGRVLLQSQPGKGTCISLLIPVALAVSGEDPWTDDGAAQPS